MEYLRNCWYAAGFGDEIPDGGMFARTLLGEPVLFFRDGDNRARALGNRCPHRFAPLHEGKLVGNDVECPYHGLRFSEAGVCVHNPHGEGKIPQAAKIKRYAVEERWGVLWIWMGDASVADLAQMPRYDDISNWPEHSHVKGYVYSAANYELMVDNLIDLSHADFLHLDTLSTSGAVTGLGPTVTERGTDIRAEWRWGPHAPMPVLRPLLPQGVTVEQHLSTTWHAPSNVHIESRTYPDQADMLEIQGYHLVTPETETSTHYFFVSTRNFLVENRDVSKAMTEQIARAFSTEDKPLIEAAQRYMATTDLWSLKPVLLECDGGAVRIRRVLRTLIEAERGMA